MLTSGKQEVIFITLMISAEKNGIYESVPMWHTMMSVILYHSIIFWREWN